MLAGLGVPFCQPGPADIVRLFLEGVLTRVFRLADAPGCGGRLLDPGEVKASATPDAPEVAGSARRIVDRLEMSHAVVKALLEAREGGALLPIVPGNGVAKVLVRVDVVEAFARDHVGPMRLGKEIGIHHVQLRRKLDAAGIHPIDDPARLRARICRLEDPQRVWQIPIS